MSKLTKFFKEIFYCPKCSAKKPLKRWGLDIICSACESAKKRWQKEQCEVF